MKIQRRDLGMSLLEIMIASAILVLVMFMIYTTLFTSTREYEVNSRRAYAVHQAQIALDEISEELRQATRVSLTPAVATPNAPSESTAVNNVSFKKTLQAVGGVKQETANYMQYLWVKTGNGGTNLVTPKSPLSGTYKVAGSSIGIDANGNGLKDEGMLVKIDPNPTTDHPNGTSRIMCTYLKPDPDGFKVTQSYVQDPNGTKMLQVHVTLTLQFTDSFNKIQEQTLESKLFVRNLQ